MNSTHYKIGTLATSILQQHDDGSGIGMYELDVLIKQKLLDNSRNKSELVKATIATYLASAVHDTTVPSSYWHLVIQPRFQTAFNWPEVMKFDL